MGKRNNDFCEKGDTKVLYKKSMSTIRTRSKTYSGHSQIFNKNSILQLKKDISQTNTFNRHDEKRKRDLAIETNVCMLRNHYIKKRIRRSFNDTNSAKSKFSTITNVKASDDTASGDSKQTPEAGDNAATLKNVDIVSVIVDNFKALLNKWIRENILENNENSQKLDTVRDSLLHKLELNVPKENISHATFVYHSKISKNRIKCYNRPKGKKKYLSTIKAKNKMKSVVKFSRYTIPFQCKKLRIVSTLSIPRQFEKSSLRSRDSHGNAFYTLRKISRNNIYLSLTKPKELLVGSSTFNLLAMSSQSLTKRCATYEVDTRKQEIMAKKVAFQRKQDYQNIAKPTFAIRNNSTGSTTPPKKGFDNVPSLVKSIYGNISPAASPSYVFLMSDNYTMTEYSTSPDTINGESESSECNEQCHETNFTSDILSEKDCSDPMLTIDFISQSLEFPPITIGTPNTPRNILHKKICSRNNRPFRKRVHTKCRRLKNNTSNTDDIKSKHFTYLYKRVNRKNSESNEFLNHFQNILKHFTESDGQKNIRLDVQVNVFPITENAATVSKTEIIICDNQNNPKTRQTPSRRSLDTLIESQETEPLSTKESNLESKNSPEIITLLDGAVSQAKYILNVENKCLCHENKSKEFAKVSDCSTLTADLEISQEIDELKSVVQGLAVTAEKLMSVHLREKNDTILNQSYPQTTVLFNPTAAICTSSDNSQTPIKAKDICKYASKGIQISENFIKKNTYPEFKLKKDPKKPNKAELNARLMAKSTTYRFIDSESILKVTDMTSQGNNVTGLNDVGLTCSFPKSKSLFEVTAEKDNRKLMAFYCDGVFRQPCHVTADCSSILSSMCQPQDPVADCGCPSSAKTQALQCQSVQTIELPGSPNCCTSVSDCPEEGRNLLNCDNISDVCPKCRRSVGFYEGCLYCLVIWIPVIIIIFLFYLTVIKNALPKTLDSNSTKFYLKMSDLGF